MDTRQLLHAVERVRHAVHVTVSGKRLNLWFVLLPSLLLAAGGASADGVTRQTADDAWSPTVAEPAFPRGDGPLVLVDAAHGNFHTIDGRFAAFAELLELDGYRVRSADTAVTEDLLKPADVFVISNAAPGGGAARRTLPAVPAFTPDEIDVIVEWVRAGGSLLLIADHMPFPGATAGLANQFGVIFLNGFAMKSLDGGGNLSFTLSSGSLADHEITRGRSESERIESVRSFTGQAFRFVGPVTPLMHMPDDWIVLLPYEAWEHSESTASVSARGLIQGGVLRFGSGRVAVFGEAAMFTAQSSVRNGVVRTAGMNHPLAGENAQFVLNVIHWLSGLLDESS